MPSKTRPADRFRAIALAHEGAVEGAHMGHPDFRLENKIFASLHSNDRFGMVKLTPEQQETFVRDNPGAFAPEAGAWGRAGCTRVILENMDDESVGEAMTLAWQGIQRSTKKTARRSTERAPRRSRRSTKNTKDKNG